MTTNDPALRQIIEAALARHPGPVADASLQLWRKLAPDLISIIGELGFDTLFARSVRLAQLEHAWIRQAGDALHGNDLFAQLQQSLQAQDAAQSSQASLLLFAIFFDLLTSLIGESLTNHLVRSAWRHEDPKLRGNNLNEE